MSQNKYTILQIHSVEGHKLNPEANHVDYLTVDITTERGREKRTFSWDDWVETLCSGYFEDSADNERG